MKFLDITERALGISKGTFWIALKQTQVIETVVWFNMRAFLVTIKTSTENLKNLHQPN